MTSRCMTYRMFRLKRTGKAQRSADCIAAGRIRQELAEGSEYWIVTERVHQYGGPVHVQYQAVQTCKTRGLLAQNDKL